MEGMALEESTDSDMQMLAVSPPSQEALPSQTSVDGGSISGFGNPCVHGSSSLPAVSTNLANGDLCTAPLTMSTALLSSSSSSSGGGAAAFDRSDCLLRYNGRVMTDEQFETLRRQISVYSTICSQLVEMHKALMTQQALMPSSMLAGQAVPFDPVLAAIRSTGRQRWTPSQIQLQILESVFEKSNGTPSKQKIKEVTVELGQHGSISETNVYNWFQNRKARAKRKQHHKEGESEADGEEMDTRKDKRATLEMFQECNGQLNGRGGSGSFTSFGGLPHGSSNVFESSDSGVSQPMHVQSQVDVTSLFSESVLQKNDELLMQVGYGAYLDYVADLIKEFSTIMVLIDGKPWEVPSTTLDLKGSFGETSALLDSQRHMVPTDERGFTTRPLHAGENYTLIKLNSGA